MILGTGIDIVNISRIEKLLNKSSEKFEEKIFCKSEIKSAKKFTNLKMKSRFYAKRFAAKEAFSKAIGLGIGRGVNFVDIQIFNDTNGKPEIKLSESSITFLKNHLKQDNFKIDLSLSDELEVATAIVIISN